MRTNYREIIALLLFLLFEPMGLLIFNKKIQSVKAFTFILNFRQLHLELLRKGSNWISRALKWLKSLCNFFRIRATRLENNFGLGSAVH